MKMLKELTVGKWLAGFMVTSFIYEKYKLQELRLKYQPTFDKMEKIAADVEKYKELPTITFDDTMKMFDSFREFTSSDSYGVFYSDMRREKEYRNFKKLYGVMFGLKELHFHLNYWNKYVDVQINSINSLVNFVDTYEQLSDPLERVRENSALGHVVRSDSALVSEHNCKEICEILVKTPEFANAIEFLTKHKKAYDLVGDDYHACVNHDYTKQNKCAQIALDKLRAEKLA